MHSFPSGFAPKRPSGEAWTGLGDPRGVLSTVASFHLGACGEGALVSHGSPDESAHHGR